MSVGGLILFGSVVPSHAKKRPGYDCSREKTRVRRTITARRYSRWYRVCVCHLSEAKGPAVATHLRVFRCTDGGIDVRYQHDILS